MLKDIAFGTIQTDFDYKAVDESHIVHLSWTEEEAAAADDDGIIDGQAITSSADVEVTEFLAQPPCARTLKATVAGTAGNVKAVSIVVTGKDAGGNVLVEELPAFTADTTGSVTSTKVFAEITHVLIPAMDGNVTIDLGWTASLGVPFKLSGAIPCDASLNGIVEASKPALFKNADDVNKNYIILNSALNGKAVEAWLTI